MVGTAFETRSEVGSVLHAYREAGLFERWPVDYVESHHEGSLPRRAFKAFEGLLAFLLVMVRHPRSVLHVHSCAGPSFWRKAVFMSLALAVRWPVVFHLHGTGFATFYDARCGDLRRSLVRFFLDRAACIVVVSPRWCAWMNRVTRNPRVVAIAPPVAMPAPAAAREAFLVADASSSAHGGAEELSQALASLRAQFPALRVERVEGLSHRARADLYARAAVVVMPDHAEGWPLRLLEAMAAGAPLVATAVGGMVDLVDHGFSGFLVPPRDAGGLASALRRILESPALAREMGRAARATIASRFSADRALESLDRIYSQLGVGRAVSTRIAPAAAPFPTTFTAARRLQEN